MGERFEAADSASVNQLMERTVERFCRLDGLTHLVGSLLLKHAHLIEDAD